MIDKSELAIVRRLSLRELEGAKSVIDSIAAGDVTSDEFDSLTIDVAARLNVVSRLYADLADCFGMAAFSERGEKRKVIKPGCGS